MALVPEHVLYRFWNAAGQLLYIGITNDAHRRFTSHGKDKPWWPEVVSITMQKYEDRLTLIQAEMQAIQVEHPIYNITHNGGLQDTWQFICPHCDGELVIKKGRAPGQARSAEDWAEESYGEDELAVRPDELPKVVDF